MESLTNNPTNPSYSNFSTKMHPANEKPKLTLNEQISQLGESIAKPDLSKILGCKTASEAVQYVISHQLPSADLSSFKDLVDEDLEKLSRNSPQLQNLSITSAKVGRSVNAWKNLTNLQSLALNTSWSKKFEEDNFVRELVYMTNLHTLEVPFATNLGETFLDGLTELPKLTNLDVSMATSFSCDPDMLLRGLKPLTQLESLSILGYGVEITDLIPFLKNHPQLKVLRAAPFRENELALIKKTLPDLETPGQDFMCNVVEELKEV